MNRIKPNYTNLGLSYSMGLKLRQLVEQQLTEDLKFYHIDIPNLHFDWSDSCIEGHDTKHLDGSVENFSGISVFNSHDNLIANGWMEFINEGDFFLAYWEFVTIWDNEKKVAEKRDKGIPKHIWRQIPDYIKPNFENERMKENLLK